MPISMKKYVAVFLLLCVSLISGANWFYTGDFAKFFLLSHYIESKSEHIEAVDVEFEDRTVILNVRVRKPMTCVKVITELGINNIVVGNKIFEPICKPVNKNLIKIFYIEVVSV